MIWKFSVKKNLDKMLFNFIIQIIYVILSYNLITIYCFFKNTFMIAGNMHNYFKIFPSILDVVLLVLIDICVFQVFASLIFKSHFNRNYCSVGKVILIRNWSHKKNHQIFNAWKQFVQLLRTFVKRQEQMFLFSRRIWIRKVFHMRYGPDKSTMLHKK